MATETPSGIGAWFDRLIERDIWERELSTYPAGRRLVVTVLRLISTVVAEFDWDRLSVRAAALTYVTIFSLVPTLAVAFAMFNAFGGLDRAEDVLIPKILDYIAVGSRVEVQERIEEFIRNIHGGAIGGVGIVFLFLSAISLLGGLEDGFNEIWRVRERRTFFQRLTTYWTMVSVTPLLLFIGIGFRPALRRIETLEWVLETTGVGHLLFSLVLPLLFICVAFTLTYAIIPNTHVRMRHAAAGGIVGGTLWSAAAAGYAWYATQAVTYSRIYGSLGALLIFLLWIYLTWVIVLAGARVASAAENLSASGTARRAYAMSQAAREVLALRIMCEVSRRFMRGAEAPTAEGLARDLRYPVQLVAQVASRLVELRMVAEIAERRTFVPARDPRQMLPSDVLRSLRRSEAADMPEREDEDVGRILAFIEQGDQAARAAWEHTTFADLILAPEQAAQ